MNNYYKINLYKDGNFVVTTNPIVEWNLAKATAETFKASGFAYFIDKFENGKITFQYYSDNWEGDVI
jgi:hypothetical protein